MLVQQLLEDNQWPNARTQKSLDKDYAPNNTSNVAAKRNNVTYKDKSIEQLKKIQQIFIKQSNLKTTNPAISGPMNRYISKKEAELITTIIANRNDKTPNVKGI